MRDWYMLTLCALLAIAAGVYATEVWAQEGDDDSAAVEEPAAQPVPVDTEDVMDPDAEVETTDLAEDIDAVAANIEAVKDADDKTAKFMAIMALIAAVLKLALDGFRKYAKVLLGKKEVRIAALVVGLLIFLGSYLGGGMEWINALLLALGGPGAILVTEISKIAKADKE